MKTRQKAIVAGVVLLAVFAIGIAVLVANRPIGTAEWQQVQDRILLQLMPAENNDLVELVARPLSDDLDIGVAIDEAERYVFVKPADLHIWGITEDELYDQALENLEGISEDVDIQLYQSGSEDSGKYIILELTDGYAAVRLLTENVRRTVARELGNTYYAAAPTRDFLIFWRDDFPFATEFLKQVQTEYEAEPTYRLSPNLFIVSPAGIQPVRAVQN